MSDFKKQFFHNKISDRTFDVTVWSDGAVVLKIGEEAIVLNSTEFDGITQTVEKIRADLGIKKKNPDTPTETSEIKLSTTLIHDKDIQLVNGRLLVKTIGMYGPNVVVGKVIRCALDVPCSVGNAVLFHDPDSVCFGANDDEEVLEFRNVIAVVEPKDAVDPNAFCVTRGIVNISRIQTMIIEAEGWSSIVTFDNERIFVTRQEAFSMLRAGAMLFRDQ